MRPYLAILSARFRLLLQYRAAAAAGFGCQLFWGLIRMMIFQAFYAGTTVSAPMTIEQVVTYVWLGQAFLLLIPIRTDHELAEKIRTGNVAYELLRPIDLYWHWFSREIAARIAPVMLRAAPMLVVATLAGWLKWTSPAAVAACAAALVVASLLSAAFCMLISITMFWTVSGRGTNAIIAGICYLLSGLVIPLPLFPDFLQPILSILPFRGLMDVPFRLFMGHIPISQLPIQLAGQLAWTAGLVLAGRWFLARSVGKLVIQGG